VTNVGVQVPRTVTKRERPQSRIEQEPRTMPIEIIDELR
jgi:hypothetical protein